jgi:Fic family protein
MTLIYRKPSAMEPLMPSAERERLAELSARIYRKSGELRRALPSLLVRDELTRLTQKMNSYYSNLIEGHKTLPKDIEKALRQDYSPESEAKRNQLLSVAHIEAEIALRERLATEPGLDVFDPLFIAWLHRAFYESLPQSEWSTRSLSGKTYPLIPGVLRDYNVDVGQHTPPDHPTLPAFLDRFRSAYRDSSILATDRLVAAAAAHHRLAWIHPFGDGNGRIARLHTQAILIRCEVDCGGLWTLSRGLARNRKDYFQQLALADSGRLSGLDGRGNLSDARLGVFCVFFLETALDQIEFMLELLAPEALADRIEQYTRFQLSGLSPQTRERIGRLLRALLHEGELPRGAVQSVFGLKATASRELIQIGLAKRLLKSPTPKGPLRLAFNAEVLEFYFPKLFADLPVP